MFKFKKKYRSDIRHLHIRHIINSDQNLHELNKVLSNIIDIEKNVFKVNGSSKLLISLTDNIGNRNSNILFLLVCNQKYLVYVTLYYIILHYE